MARKGFVITPIVFIGAAFVVAFLLFSYFSLNSRTVSAIDIESSLTKLRANALEARIDVSNSLYQFAFMSGSSTCTEIKAYIQSAMLQTGRNGTVDVTSGTSDYYRTTYSGKYSASIGPANLTEDMAVTRLIPGSCS